MASRQEQEPAQTEVTEVAPDVLRMQLPIHMPGLGHVNMYALIDRNGAAVVDPGLPGPSTWKAIQQRLRQAGLSVKNVHTVFVTHSHPDHFGGAARFAKEAGAEVVAHHGFAFGPVRSEEPPSEVSADDLAADDDEAAERREEPAAPAVRWDQPAPWGGKSPRPPFRQRLRWRFMRLLHKTSFAPEISQPVEHGDVLELCGREWFVLHTPGHTADHVCLHDPESGIFLAGDHVLPTITPHISGLSASRDPLKSFFYSLDRVGEIQGVKIALPAHGHPFNDLKGRAEAIKRHHHERLEKIKSIGGELGPASVRAFSERLFKPRSWGSMAESETFAHLEHLRLMGDAESHEEKGELLYHL